MSDKPKKEKPKKEKVKKEKKPKGEKAPKTKICPSCKAEIPKKAKVCPSCAAKQKGNPLPLVLAAVLAVALAAGTSVMAFHFPFAPPFELPFGGKAPSDTLLGGAMGLNREQEKAVLEVFSACGFAEISEVRSLSSNEEFSSYTVNDTETARFLEGEDAIVVALENGTKAVTAITYKDDDIYLDGRVLGQVTDYYLGAAARGAYLATALEAVKARLELPETAVFPARSKWRYELDGDKVTVRASVTVKNAAAVEEVRPFAVEFEQGEFVGVSFGGENGEE